MMRSDVDTGVIVRLAPRILIADDDPPVRDLIVRVLRDSGYRVHGVGNGEEALEILSREPYDLLLVDVWMPRMTGLELLSRLQHAGRSVPTIVMTGEHSPATALSAVREHALEYLPKPFTGELLLDRVRRALASDPPRPIDVLSDTPDWVELRVPCDRESAERSHAFLMDLESDLPQDVREGVSRAFHELLMNAVEWGGGLDPDRKVRVAFLRGKKLLLCRITSPAPSFRTRELEPGPGDSKFSSGGAGTPAEAGVMLAQTAVDELIYNQQRDEVVFIKYLK